MDSENEDYIVALALAFFAKFIVIVTMFLCRKCLYNLFYQSCKGTYKKCQNEKKEGKEGVN